MTFDESVVVEQIERISKRNNLVVVGLPEGVDGEVEVRKIARLVDGELDSNIEPSISEVFRDGPKKLPSGRPATRVLKIKFRAGAKDERFELLRNFHKHAGQSSNGRKVFVRPDLTYRQREEDRERSRQLRSIREQAEADGCHDRFKIYRGRIYNVTQNTFLA